jgi:hypothetical protein
MHTIHILHNHITHPYSRKEEIGGSLPSGVWKRAVAPNAHACMYAKIFEKNLEKKCDTRV